MEEVRGVETGQQQSQQIALGGGSSEVRVDERGGQARIDGRGQARSVRILVSRPKESPLK